MILEPVVLDTMKIKNSLIFFKATEFSQILFSIKPACYLVRKYYQNLNNFFFIDFQKIII